MRKQRIFPSFIFLIWKRHYLIFPKKLVFVFYCTTNSPEPHLFYWSVGFSCGSKWGDSVQRSIALRHIKNQKRFQPVAIIIFLGCGNVLIFYGSSGASATSEISIESNLLVLSELEHGRKWARAKGGIILLLFLQVLIITEAYECSCPPKTVHPLFFFANESFESAPQE